MQTNREGSNFYMLTAQILNDRSLSHAEKLTMAILNGLANEDGKCWPSNDWLAEKLQVKTRAVQDIISHLERLSYIKREIIACSKDPFKKYRIIHVQTNFKFNSPHAENCTPEDVKKCLPHAENCTPGMQKTACIIDKKEVIDKKEPPTSSSVCSHPEAGNVTSLLIEAIKKTKKDLKEPKFDAWYSTVERMLRIDKRSIEVVKSLIEWLPTNEFWSKNILSAENFRKQFDRLQIHMETSKKPKNALKSDQDLLKRLDEYADTRPSLDVKIGHDYVEFPTLSNLYSREGRKAYFKVGEPGFKENVTNALRKIGVPIK